MARMPADMPTRIPPAPQANIPPAARREVNTRYPAKPSPNAYSRQSTYSRQNPYSRPMQQPRVNYPMPRREMPKAAVERIRPLNPQQARARITAAQKKPQSPPARKKRRKHPSKLRDFLFGFVAGLIVFGTAAIIICSALINLLT